MPDRAGEKSRYIRVTFPEAGNTERGPVWEGSFRYLSSSLLFKDRYSFTPGIGRAPLTGGSHDLLQVKVRKSFLYLPFLKFPQLEIFNTPRCHILDTVP